MSDNTELIEMIQEEIGKWKIEKDFAYNDERRDQCIRLIATLENYLIEETILKE